MFLFIQRVGKAQKFTLDFKRVLRRLVKQAAEFFERRKQQRGRKGSADRQLDSMEQILRIIRLEMEVIILCTGAGTIRALQQIFTLNISLAFLDTD